MANVLNRTTLEYLTSVNTPDYPPNLFVINPDLSNVRGFPTKYWILTGDTLTLQPPSQRQATDDAEFINTISTPPFDFGEFGDGSDNNGIISVNTSLVRDMFYNSLVINAGITLTTNGFRIFAKRRISCVGVIAAVGGPAVGSLAGVGAPSGTIGGGGNGAIGNGVPAANLTSNETPAYGGGGGKGGSGNGGANPGGNGGRVLTDNQIRTKPRRYDSISSGSDSDQGSATQHAYYQGGTGGGSGGGPNGGGTAGGPGGGGGGVISIATPQFFIDSTGSIDVSGGAGAFGPLNAGGGAGGGGGLILLTLMQMLNKGNIVINGGIGGSATGTGQAGQVGQDGRVISNKIG